VGAGPAGLAAATAAAQAGREAVVLDDNTAAGGQIWRSGVNSGGEKNARKDQVWREFQASGAELLAGRRVIDAQGKRILRAIQENENNSIEDFAWNRLILATGARERFLPFPGWTLPGVFGAGGLQAFVKSGFDVEGKRIVVAGSGPLLLAVAAFLKRKGAHIITVAEQAPMARIASFAARLATHPAKLWQGAAYRASLGKTPYRFGCWPVAAVGETKLTAVRLTDGHSEWTEGCDLLAFGFNLVSNAELAALIGCQLNGDCVTVDDHQQTTVEHVYCAGEPTGVAGLDAALIQGTIAGISAAGLTPSAAQMRQRNAEQAFGASLAKAFALRPELRSLARLETLVCRCEDVSFGQLAQRRSWTEAKLQTRCGMGACQGRICGPAVEELFGWRNASVRPPIFPTPISALCSTATGGDNKPDVPKNLLESL
jgi:NADPH-dependent 2,4-dienoyl-CoA reductase/sulfur reductase-like enzyme